MNVKVLPYVKSISLADRWYVALLIQRTAQNAAFHNEVDKTAVAYLRG